jgi:hypothetical protein
MPPIDIPQTILMLERISLQPIRLFRFVQYANMQHNVDLEKFRIRLLGVDVQANTSLSPSYNLGTSFQTGSQAVLPGSK